MDMPAANTRTEAAPAQTPPTVSPPSEAEPVPPAAPTKVKAAAPANIPAIIVGVVIAAVATLSIYYLVRGQPLLVQGEVDATRFDIAARVDGRVGEVPVTRGQNVAATAVLVRIDNPETIAKHEQAVAAKVVADAQLANINVGTRPETIAARKAALERAQAALVLAQQTHERVRQLAERGNAPQARLDQATDSLHESERAVDQAKSAYEQAVNGYTKEEREIAQANVGKALADIKAVAQARAAVDAATADRDHVYAGVRAEQIAALAAEIAKAKSKLDYVQAQLTRIATLARGDVASQQALDQATNDVAAAKADVAEAEANHAAAVAGPTKEERLIADSQVQAAGAALAVLERHLGKTVLRSPVDGVVSVVVAEVGENIHAGQPVFAIAATGKNWLSFNAREDLLHGLTVGTTVAVARAGTGETMPAIVTELRPLGTFATWQAERAVGDHDRNTLRLRLDPSRDATGLEPGMKVWMSQ